MAQGVDQLTGKNISLNKKDYEEFLNLSNQLAEIFPALTNNYTANNDAIIQLTGNVDTIIGSLQNLIETQRELANKEIADNIPVLFKGIAKQSTQYKREIEDLKTFSEVTTYLDVDSWEISAHDQTMLNSRIEHYQQILEESGIKFIDAYTSYETPAPETFHHKAKIAFKLDASVNWEKLKKNEDPKIQEYVKKYENDVQDFKVKIENVNEKNKKNWSSLNSSVFAWLNTDASFKVMDDSTQAIMQNIINNLDWGANSLNFSNWEKAKEYINNNILSLFNEEDNQTLSKIELMLDIQTQFNNGDITVEEYQNKLQEFSEGITDLPDEVEKSILCLFGVQTTEDGSTSSDIDILINNVKSKLQDKFHDKVGELTLDELQIASELEVNYGTHLSWDELIAKINEPHFLSDSEINLSLSKDNIDDFQSKLSTLADT